MFHVLLAGVIARAAASTATLASPRGHGKLTVQVPADFNPGRLKNGLLFTSGSAQISVNWTANRVTPVLLKAINKNTEELRKKGQVIGSVSVGPYRGPLLQIPIKPHGISVHAAMIHGRDLLSISYYIPNLHGTSPNSIVATVKNIIASARLIGT